MAIARGGTSQVSADFNEIDIAGPLTALAGSAVPLAGRATGRVDLTFPGTEYKLASGTVSTRLTAEAGETSGDRIPITGEVAMRAERGMFDIQQVNLQTPATKLTATGRFSFENDSDLQVDLNSSDAAELQTQRRGERADQRRLSQSGNAFQQRVTADEEAGEHAVNDFVVADNGLSDFGSLPRGRNPSAPFHAVQGGIERAFLDAERVVGRVLDPARDAIPMARAAGERLQDQQIERALE